MAEKDLTSKKIRVKSAPKQKIGIDLDNTLSKDLLDAAENSLTDLNTLQNFTSISQTRENIYSIIDAMAEDTTISSVLETYAEDVCEPNDQGQIIWCEAGDTNVNKMVTYLLDTMNVDKSVYNWAFSLIKYGDLYLRLFRESDYKEDIFNSTDIARRQKLNESSYGNTLNDNLINEDVILQAYDTNDHYTHYIEKVPNPGEMFELTRHGKTMGYIKTNSIISPSNSTSDSYNADFYQYNLKKNSNDVHIYQATDFVHAALEDNTSRSPEEVTLFINDADYDSNTNGYTYTVKRGQSLLANVFKTWRELSLLKNSVLLNRLTRSSIVRLIQVEVGDMSKNQVQATLSRLKSMVEQKSALKSNEKMTEYTNPGPVENNIYIPTHGGQGAISTSEMGGDIDVKGLVDLDYWYNDLFGGLRVPKQYFGYSDDAGGFDGGTSLSLMSSRYGKSIKRIQATLTQAITDAINLMLLDKGLDSYVNKFTIKMQSPSTQEEKDRRDNTATQLSNIRDTLDLLADIEDPSVKLKITKSLLSTVITDTDVLSYIQDEIDALESEAVDDAGAEDVDDASDDLSFDDTTEDTNENKKLTEIPLDDNVDSILDTTPSEALPTPGETDIAEKEEPTNESLQEDLPSFTDLNIDGYNWGK